VLKALLQLKPRDVPIVVALRNTAAVTLPLALGVASDHVGVGLGISALSLAGDVQVTNSGDITATGAALPGYGGAYAVLAASAMAIWAALNCSVVGVPG